MRNSTMHKVEVVISTMRRLDRVIVALSGGVDSAVLLSLARERSAGDDILVRGLATARLVGAVIAARAPAYYVPRTPTADWQKSCGD